MNEPQPPRPPRPPPPPSDTPEDPENFGSGHNDDDPEQPNVRIVTTKYDHDVTTAENTNGGTMDIETARQSPPPQQQHGDDDDDDSTGIPCPKADVATNEQNASSIRGTAKTSRNHHNDTKHNIDHHHHIQHPQFLYNSNKEQALLFEVQIMQTLLQRNQSAHGRTMYYRRTQMALHHIQTTILQSSSTTLFQDWTAYLHQQTLIPLQRQLRQQIRDYHQTPNIVKKKDVVTRPKISRTTTATTNETMTSIMEKLLTELTIPVLTTETTTTTTTTMHHSIWHCILYNIPNGVGRIEYAFTNAGRLELVRGFFLSLVTLLMAGLARIYVLLLQLQYTLVVQYLQYLSELRQTIQLIHNDHNSNRIHEVAQSCE